MEHGEAGQGGEGADGDPGAFRLDGGVDRSGLQLAGLEQLLEAGGHDDAKAGEQGHDVDGEGHEEGIAPAPVQEVGRRQGVQEEGEQGRGDDQADGRAQLGNHGVPAAAILGGVDRQKRSQAVPGAPQRDALTDAEDSEQYGGGDADGFIAGQEGHRDGRGAQQEQRYGKLGAAPELLVDGDEQGRAERAGQEGQGEDREGQQRAADRPGEREDQLRKHDHGSDGVDEEVKELRRPANDHADGDFAGVHLAVIGVEGCGVAFQRL